MARLKAQEHGKRKAGEMLARFQLSHWTREQWIGQGKDQAAGVYFSQAKRDQFGPSINLVDSTIKV
jgi:hypothetical protein